MENIEQKELIEFIKNAPKRADEKPETRGPTPHQQISQYPESNDFADALHNYTMTFEGIVNGESHIGDGGLRAYFIEKNTNQGFEQHFLVDNEFAHIHRHGSKSLHLVLPSEIGEIVTEKGWTEQHPLAQAQRIPHTNYMLFGARSTEELAVSKALMRISYLFSIKKW